MPKIVLYTIANVISILMLCNPAYAEESSFFDGFHLGGYSSAGIYLPRHQPAEASLNEVSLILTWENNSRLTFFGELELERPLTWNAKQHLTVRDAYLDLERFYFDYNVSEKLNIRAGRFLTPAGRWNLLHAAPLVWTSSRPIVTEALFPSSINALMLFGSVPLLDGAVEYNAFYEIIEDQIIDNDETIYEHVKGGHISFNNLLSNNSLNEFGLTLASYQEDSVFKPKYRLFGADFLVTIDALELSGEAYYRFNDASKNGGNGAYIQSAYHLGNAWYWLSRIETANLPNTGEEHRWLIGATKRLKPNQLLKFEYLGGNGDGFNSPRGFSASFAILF